MSAIQKTNPLNAAIVEKVVIGGDLSVLNEKQRVEYYSNVCHSLGLNPLTKPFDYIKLNGKLTLYAKRDATDQLRSIHKVSVSISCRERIDDVYVVTAKAKNSDGREDESTGAVNVAGLKGDALANAFMKAETKAKRRVTLSICGLGLLDETEVETIRDVSEAASEPVKNIFQDYVVTFGKWKGQRLIDQDPYEVLDYVKYLEMAAGEQGKPIKGVVLEFIEKANEFVDSKRIVETPAALDPEVQ